jgi:hypothetical protein
MNKQQLRQILADKLRHYRYRIQINMYAEEAKIALNYLYTLIHKKSFTK